MNYSSIRVRLVTKCITEKLDNIIPGFIYLNYKSKGECTMWVITVFEQNNIRTFEYTNKLEATNALQQFNQHAILSYTQ